MSICLYDNNADCLSFDAQHGIEFPTISADEGNGDDICNAYNISAYPTYILIAPDHSIAEQDMWPISSAADFDPYLTNNGIAEHNCNATYIPRVELDDILTVYPNPSNGVFNLDISYNGNVKVEVTNILGVSILEKQFYVNNGVSENIDLSGNNEGIYFVTIKTDRTSYVKKIKLIDK